MELQVQHIMVVEAVAVTLVVVVVAQIMLRSRQVEEVVVLPY
jgi:hypothetical protein